MVDVSKRDASAGLPNPLGMLGAYGGSDILKVRYMPYMRLFSQLSYFNVAYPFYSFLLAIVIIRHGWPL